MSDLPLSPTQLDAIRGSTARVNLYSGAIRSGKTIASLLRWLVFLASAPRGGQLVVVGRTRDSVARNVFAPLTDPSLFGPVADQVHYTAGAPTARILDRTVYVLGASDAKAEKVLRGVTVAGAYVDELTVVAEDFFTQLLGRMSVPGAQLFATTNPDSPAHWVKRRYLDRLGELPDWRSFTFQLDDNPALTQSYKNSIRREYTGLWYRRFVLGEWVAAEGAIFNMWEPSRHVVPWSALPGMVRLLAVGIDHGTTVATAAVLLGEGVDRRLYLVDEWRHDPAHARVRLTDSQLSAGLRDWLALGHLPRPTGLRPQWIVADPSAASFRVQLHNDGVSTQAADNDVAYGIRLMGSLLAEHRLLVADRCRGFITEAPGYSWSDEATAKGHDQPVKVADHCLAPATLITTEHGPQPIAGVRVGTRVLTRDGWRPVTASWQSSPRATVVTLALSTGNEITGTPHHRVWTLTRGWVPMSELLPGEELLTCTTPSCSTEPGSTATRARHGEPTACTSPPVSPLVSVASSDYMRKSGCPCTAPFPRVTTSTTPTTTPVTTIPATSCACPPPSTAATTAQTQKPKPHAAPISGWPILPTSARLPPHGTAANRDEPGTANTPGESPPPSNPAQPPATTAARSTTRPNRNDSAATPANQPGAAPAEWTTSNATAPTATHRSRSTNTPNGATAPVRVLHVRTETHPSPVHDLTVADAHEFFANGILVHNSLDAGRYAITTTENLWRPTLALAA